MAYIGRGTENISNVEVLDNLTFNGSASYTLQKSSTNFVPSSANNLLISISGVVQQGNFSVSGSTITFDTTVASSDTCDWILHYGTGLITTVADGAITEAKLGSNAVTTAKINDSAVTYAKTDGNFGKIGQVVQTVKTDTYSQSTTSFTDITGMSASITPSSTNSKIYVMIALNVGSNNASQAQFKLLRGSTTINVGDSSGSRQQGFAEVDGQNAYAQTPTTSNFLDSPNTTSSITYKIQMRVTGQTHYLNRSVNDNDADFESRTSSSITLMEVLA